MTTSETQARRNVLKMGAGAVGLATLAVAPSVAHASAQVPQSGGGLPIGSWDLHANGYRGTLQLSSYDEGGNLTATLTIHGEPTSEVVGFYNATEQTVFFNRIPNRANPRSYQIYTGYLFGEASRIVLAGSFETFAAGSAARYTYGWYAVFQG